MKKPYPKSIFSAILPRTDLACEAIDPKRSSEGTSLSEYSLNGLAISRLTVENEAGEQITGRARGEYFTIHCPAISTPDDDLTRRITDTVADTLARLTEMTTGRPIDSETRILVAGLGNRFISADSIGPRTADKIAVTSHMMEGEHSSLFKSIGCSSLSAVHPGVMGQTGIEAAAMIKGAAEYVKPHAVIAVDALAARSLSRLCTTIQLCNTGISPGSGIGNRRCAVDRDTIGYPVIAIGVPTVVDCATLIFDTLRGADPQTDTRALESALCRERELFVSPRDCDTVSEDISSVLANAINHAFFCKGL